MARLEELTEDLIKKISGKSLVDVAELNLSNRRLKRLDVGLFQRMTSLVALNVANNELKALPCTNVLSNLKRLDVSENCLHSLEFVEQMPQLEQLHIEGNGLQLADKLAAVYLCPSLTTIDNKSTDQLKSAIRHCKDKFQPIVKDCWFKSFSETFGARISAEECNAVIQSLVADVRTRKLCSPGVPASFRDFMINKLATDLVLKVSRGQCSREVEEEPMEVVQTALDADENCNISKSDMASPCSRFKPCAPVPDYDPLHFIRCHFCDKNALKEGHTDNDPSDNKTNVWMSVMEPDPTNHGASTGIVATCGGNIVCLIDCSTGQVMRRYQEQKEQFYCLAWTTLTLEYGGRKRSTNVLAVGGFNGHLRLLHPDQLVCYGHCGTGRPNRAVVSFYYSSLVFHPSQPTWLFCGASDTTVTLFDIGIPQGAEYKTEIKQLLILVCDKQSPILNLVIHRPTNSLVAGTENGCFVWDISVKWITDSRNSSKRREPSMEIDLPVNGSPFIDGLVLIDDTFIACKSANDRFIYVLNLAKAIASKSTTACKVYGFEWTKTSSQYIGLGASNGLLACGDDHGSILLYNVKSVLSSSRKSQTGSSFFAPSRVLTWPKCVLNENDDKVRDMADVLDTPPLLIVNSVAISEDHQYIVAVTDCNLVCIWKQVSA